MDFLFDLPDLHHSHSIFPFEVSRFAQVFDFVGSLYLRKSVQKSHIMGALEAARFCSVFAIFGVVFLICVGIMLQKQPLYIRGIEDKEASASR